MDYERIEKPLSHGGGFSPKKLRAMLLGMEKKKSTGDEVDSKFSLRSELDHAEIDDERRGSHSDEFKDVDMVSSLSECSTSLDSTNPQNPRNRTTIPHQCYETKS
uniref:Uncharacterized protein n=1 Tax=Ananas comosus var. bracteatus TaxID=296719 RepID=A0A6V7PJ42_ANACO|nr:unnamed protein product [Ananas comosus var. bracteatus]